MTRHKLLPTPRPDSTVYRGTRLTGPAGQVWGVVVTVDGADLDIAPSLALACKSPTGFEWGYGGSGPGQLSLAILLDVTGDADTAFDSFQWWKWCRVVNWGDWWEITAGEIRADLEQLRRERDAMNAFDAAASEVIDMNAEVVPVDMPFVVPPDAEGGGI